MRQGLGIFFFLLFFVVWFVGGAFLYNTVLSVPMALAVIVGYIALLVVCVSIGVYLIKPTKKELSSQEEEGEAK